MNKFWLFWVLYNSLLHTSSEKNFSNLRIVICLHVEVRTKIMLQSDCHLCHDV